MSYGESVASSVVASSRSTTICAPAAKPALLGCGRSAAERPLQRHRHPWRRPASGCSYSARHSIRASARVHRHCLAWKRGVGAKCESRNEDCSSNLTGSLVHSCRRSAEHKTRSAEASQPNKAAAGSWERDGKPNGC
jgi:hypothetical protein